MKKEGKMRANDNRKPLSKVPVPGMRAIEICHAVEDVQLQEVELNQGPLKKNKEIKDTYILTNRSWSPKICLFWRVYLLIEDTVDQSWNQQSCSSKIKITKKN